MAGVPPKRGEIFNWETTLTSQADTNIDQVNPTIVAGDVVVYQDGALDGNIDTLPTPVGASAIVACTLSAAEMTADRIFVHFHDAVGAEWQDRDWEFFTVTTPLDEFIAAIWNRLITLLTIPGSIGKLLVDYINVAVSTRTTLGAGAITFTYTLTSSVDGSPIADADVWVTTDTSGSNVVASGRTNSAGVVTFYLDAGTYYLWRQKDGWNFDPQPDTEVVS